MTRNLSTALSRLGREVPVYVESNTGSEDAFGQSEMAWSAYGDGTVLAARSYQNRNTTMNSSDGQRHRDRPVFFFPVDDAPPADARIKYEGSWYELDAVTRHSTHAVAPGSSVIDETFAPDN